MARQPELLEIGAIRKEIKDSFYTIEQAAHILKVAYHTVYRRIVFGEIDASKIGGTWRIPASALIQYLEERHPFNLPEKEG